ncbi:MAG: radical SAM protein, partial [Candidatus Altiarchaeota archaeon]|nr:radical SAM protein [Candidatus Altiarchaeota archaeon]
MFCYFNKSYGCQDYSLGRIKAYLRILRILGLDNLDFIGGEPTVRGDILEILRYSRKIGFKKVSITTNGFLLGDEDFMKRCVDAGLNHATYSFAGASALIHDGNTCVNGSFDRLVKAVENSNNLELGFDIHYVILKNNFETVGEVVERFRENKPQRFEMIYFTPGFD